MENKLELIVFKGLPGSGRTETAKMLEKDGYVRISKTDIRSELFEDKYNVRDENKVISHQYELIREALSNNSSVISDDDNLDPRHIRSLKKIAKELDADFYIDDSFMDATLQECITTDSESTHPVGQRTIRKLFNQFVLREKQDELYDPELENVFLFDFDNVLTMGAKNRTPYEWNKVSNDLPNNGAIHILEAIKDWKYAKVIIVSGRDETSRIQSEKWLTDNLVESESIDKFYMRKEGDKRKSFIVKNEIYQNNIKGKYNVVGVFEDDPDTCRMYREELFLPVYQLSDPYNLG